MSVTALAGVAQWTECQPVNQDVSYLSVLTLCAVLSGPGVGKQIFRLSQEVGNGRVSVTDPKEAED